MTDVKELVRKYYIALDKDEEGKETGDLYMLKQPDAEVCAEITARKAEIVVVLQRAKAEREAAKIAKEAARIEEDRAIAASEMTVPLTYHDGDILSGYMVFGAVAETLTEIGAAKHVEGWGCRVSSEVLKALGTEWTLAQAMEFTRPAREAAEAKKAAQQAKIDAMFAQAKATGKPVALAYWREDGREEELECTKWAMPDGTTKVTRWPAI